MGNVGVGKQLRLSWSLDRIILTLRQRDKQDKCDEQTSNVLAKTIMESQGIKCVAKVKPVKASVHQLVLFEVDSWTIRYLARKTSDVFEVWYWRGVMAGDQNQHGARKHDIIIDTWIDYDDTVSFNIFGKLMGEVRGMQHVAILR